MYIQMYDVNISTSLNTNKTCCFSDWCLPGGQIIATPHWMIFHTSRGAHGPNKSKMSFDRLTISLEQEQI